MDATATTVVSRLIDEGRRRFGQLEALEVPQPLWEGVMDEVTEAGGDVGFDTCVVDGVTVRARAAGHAGDTPAFQVAGQEQLQVLPD